MVNLAVCLSARVADAGRGRWEKAALYVALGEFVLQFALPQPSPEQKDLDARPQGEEQYEPDHTGGQQTDEQCDVQTEHF